MKVLGLYAKNILRLKEVQIKPDGTMVPISGKNGQGKSSVLNCLWIALQAASAKKALPQIIRDGEEKAQIILDIGEYTIVRRFKRESSGEITTALTVEEANGSTVKRPQSFLDGLISSVSFDPVAFEMMSPRDRRQCLIEVFGLNVDKYDEEIEDIKEEKKELSAELKLIMGQLSSIAAPKENDVGEEKSAVTLVDELGTLNLIARQRAEALKKVDDLNRLIAEKQAELTEIVAVLKKIPENINEQISEKKAELEDVEARNSRIRDAKRYHELSSRVEVLQKNLKIKNNAIELKKIERDEEIEGADLPVDGLEITVDGILFDGIPFDQKSQAERIKISMAVAMAANPQLKVIRITNGSLFDRENLKLIQQLAEERDYQVWIELVDDTATVGFYIEDGEVVTVNT